MGGWMETNFPVRCRLATGTQITVPGKRAGHSDGGSSPQTIQLHGPGGCAGDTDSSMECIVGDPDPRKLNKCKTTVQADRSLRGCKKWPPRTFAQLSLGISI